MLRVRFRKLCQLDSDYGIKGHDLGTQGQLRGLIHLLHLAFLFKSKRASDGMLESNDSSPGSLAEPPILPLVPLIAGSALVAPLHAFGTDLMLSSMKAGVVVAVQRLLPVRYEGSSLQKRTSVMTTSRLAGSEKSEPH